MARLILMRHAKSSWANADLSDHQRPLNKRGRGAAPIVARRIVDAGWAPDLALVSDAARTEETWAYMAQTSFPDTPSHLVPSLYHGTLADIVEAVRTYVRDHETVLVLGHNPGWEDAAHALSGRRLTLKTANAVLLSSKTAWPAAIKASWVFEDLLTPR